MLCHDKQAGTWMLQGLQVGQLYQTGSWIMFAVTNYTSKAAAFLPLGCFSSVWLAILTEEVDLGLTYILYATYLIKKSLSRSSMSSTFLGLAVNSDLCFACSYVLPVLCKVCCPANTFPMHNLSGVHLSLTHQYASNSSLPISLAVVPPSSLAQPPLVVAAQLVFSCSLLLAFVVPECCQLSLFPPSPLGR